MKLIDKDALVAEIENLENTYKKCPTRNSYEEGLKDGRLIGYKDALHKINILEVKEVDLEKEYEEFVAKTDWLQELQEKLDSLSKEDFKKVWDKYKLREEGSVDYDKLNTMLDESLSKETKESWNKRLGEEPVSDDLEAFVNSTYPDRKVVLGRGNTCLSCGRVQREACITGANWQKKKDFQDESDMAVVAYMDGVEKGKKMMREQMKNAINGIKAEIEKAIAEEILSYETSCSEGYEEFSTSPAVYMRLQMLLAKIDNDAK